VVFSSSFFRIVAGTVVEMGFGVLAKKKMAEGQTAAGVLISERAPRGLPTSDFRQQGFFLFWKMFFFTVFLF